MFDSTISNWASATVRICYNCFQQPGWYLSLVFYRPKTSVRSDYWGLKHSLLADFCRTFPSTCLALSTQCKRTCHPTLTPDRSGACSWPSSITLPSLSDHHHCRLIHCLPSSHPDAPLIGMLAAGCSALSHWIYSCSSEEEAFVSF